MVSGKPQGVRGGELGGLFGAGVGFSAVEAAGTSSGRKSGLSRRISFPINQFAGRTSKL